MEDVSAPETVTHKTGTAEPVVTSETLAHSAAVVAIPTAQPTPSTHATFSNISFVFELKIFIKLCVDVTLIDVLVL